jgi:hypothetical protein
LYVLLIVLETMVPDPVPFLTVDYFCPFVAPVDTNTVVQFDEVAVNAPIGTCTV